MTTRHDMLRLFVSLVAIASFCIGVGGLIEYIRLGNVAGKAVFLSPYFSAVVMLCGLLLYAPLLLPRYARLLALVAVTAIVVARLAPQWSDVWVNGRMISTSFATALVLAGAGAVFLIRRNATAENYRIPPRDFAIALLGVTASTLISFALIEENIELRQQFAESSARTVANDIGDRTLRAKAIIKRLGERWSAMSAMPEESFIQEEFGGFSRDFTFFRGFALVDETGSIVLEHNRNEDGEGWVEALGVGAALNDVLRQTHATGQVRQAVLEQTRQDRKIGVVVSPLYSPSTNGWSVIAGIDLAEIVTWAMRRSDDSGYFRVSHEGRVLYQTADEPPFKAVAAGDIVIPGQDGVELQLHYRYTPTDTDLDTEVWAEFVWLAGILLTLLLIASRRLTTIAQKRAVQLSHNALHDPLTGLPNRHVLEQKLARACRDARNTKQPVSVVFFDVDGIRLINDSVSHAMGDAVIIDIAKRLQHGTRVDTAVQQLGNAEFVVLFDGMDAAQVQRRTECIIDALSKPYHVAGVVLSVSVNAGIVISDGKVDDPMELVRQADLAMLRAKQQGRNTWHAYTEDLSAEVLDRVRLRDDLQVALETQGLQLHYQPIIEGHSGCITGVETLVRWPHKTRGYISPAHFIPLAEDTGQIIALTQWVLTTACHDRVLMCKSGLPRFPIMVNISPLYFQLPDFIENIQQVLRDTDLSAELLELEITESVFLDNEEAVLSKLAQLRDMGIKTSIDDFGTGYSSLAYLKNLPIDKVKIDRSFIIDVVSNPADAAIVQGIISMAHHLGLSVVAEGIETEPQFAFLKRNHCNAFQGYLFAKPLPFDELLARFSHGNDHRLRPEPAIIHSEPEEQA